MTRQRNKKLLYAFLSLFLLVVSIIGGWGFLPAFADTAGSESALQELQKDSSFKVSDYPDKANDYSISVIQIAESTLGGLYLYTYQPCQKTTYLVATKINMSLTDKMGGIVNSNTELTDEDKPKPYSLTLINTWGVFAKYRVDNFTVSKAQTRYYNISAIYREWLSGIDNDSGNDNTINGKAFRVGKCYAASTINGEVVYDCIKKDVVEIIDPYHSYITVDNSSSLSGWSGGTYARYKFTDMHYIAFSTDWKIDCLISADVNYFYCDGHYVDNDFLWWNISSNVTYGKSLEKTVTLESDDSHIIEDSGSSFLGSHFTKTKYEWNKICSVTDFCKDVKNNTDYSEDVKNQICDEVSGKQWVLLFVTTERKEERSAEVGFITDEVYFTKVENVTVLRLKFESEGTVYNLGTVSDTVSSPKYPEEPKKDDEFDFWQWLLEKLKYVWNCIVNLFTNRASTKEKIVAVVGIVGAVIVLGLVVAFLRFLKRCFVGKG